VLSKGGWDSLQNSVVGGLTLWEETFAGGTGSITRLYREMWDDIKIISKNGWDYVQDSMVTGIEFIVETFKDPRKKFAEGGKGLIGALGQGMRATGTFTEDSFAWALGGIDDLMSHSDAKKGPLSNLTASGSALVTTFASGITSAAGVAVNTLSGVMSDLRNLLPFSDAKEGPLSELTKSGSTVLSTFASGIEKTADAPLRAVSGALSNISMEPPNLPAASSTRESGGGAKAGVVFEPGAFQITVNGADGLDDLEGQLTEIFSRAALRLGVANG